VLGGIVQAQVISSGVSQGMTFEYHTFSNWTSSNPDAEIPVEMSIVNQTSYFQVMISEVFDTVITTTNICYYDDGGSGVVDRGIIDLETGEVTFGYANEGDSFAAIIGANLNVGDVIHPNGDDGLKILDATTRTYKSGDRVVNHVRMAYDEIENGYRWARDVYFDKETGILVEQKDWAEVSTMYSVSVSQITWELRSVSGVSGWMISEEKSITTIEAIAIGIIIVLIVVAAFFVIRNKKH